MNWLHLVSYFFGGVFLANAVPHLVAGTMGRSFQTPFAKPPGKGLSSSVVNALWGWFNLAVAYLLIVQVGQFELRWPVHGLPLGLGILLKAVLGARQMGKFHGGNGSS